jgi:hypothetical protein
MGSRIVSKPSADDILCDVPECLLVRQLESHRAWLRASESQC